jgi:hypothetical protein
MNEVSPILLGSVITFLPRVCYVFAGTRVEDAKALIAASPMKILAIDNLDEAAKMVSAGNGRYSSNIQ